MPRESWRDDPEYLALWRAARQRGDAAPRLVLADWLEEKGHLAEAWRERLHGLTGEPPRFDPDTGAAWSNVVPMTRGAWRRLLAAPPADDLLCVFERDVLAYQYLRRYQGRVGWALRQSDWSSATERGHLLAVPRLEMLSCGIVGPAGWDWVMDSLPGLTHFEAEGPQIDTERLAGVRRLPRLRALRLYGNATRDSAALGELPGLRHLSLAPFSYQADRLAAIAPELESLHADPFELGDTVRWPRLRSLKMHKPMGEPFLGTRELTALARHPLLERLEVRCGRVTGSAVGALAALPNLRELTLRFEAGRAVPPLKALAEAPALESLTVEGTVSDARLLEVARIDGLRALALGQVEVGSRGLAALAGMRRLEELRLGGEATAVAGLTALAALPLLAKLDLQLLTMPPQAAAAVKAACPPWLECPGLAAGGA